MATSSRKAQSSKAKARGTSRGRAAGGSPARSRSASQGHSGASARAGAKTTTDHDQIRRWAEARGAQPACVRGTGGKGDPGMIRLDFPGFSGEDKLQPISWDEFFEAFDENDLALLYQEKTKGGQKSNFNKLVSRAASTRGRSRSGQSHKGESTRSRKG
jgi:hypothetical protein